MKRDALPTLRAQAAHWAEVACAGAALGALAREQIGPAWRAAIDAASDDEALRRAAIELLRGVLALGRWAQTPPPDSAVPPLAARLLAARADTRHGTWLEIELRLPMDARLAAAMPWARTVETLLRDAGIGHQIEHACWPERASAPAAARALWCWGCQSMCPAADFGSGT